jgi:hypothetical protein
MKPRRDVYKIGLQSYKLSADPLPDWPLLVFVNGLLMAPGSDYVMSGRLLVFVLTHTLEIPTATVQAVYWSAA